jgi:hypothetical protein
MVEACAQFTKAVSAAVHPEMVAEPLDEHEIVAVSAQATNASSSGTQLGYVVASIVQLAAQVAVAVAGHAVPRRTQTLAHRSPSDCPPAGGASSEAPDGSLELPDGSVPKGLNGGVAGPVPPPQPRRITAPLNATLARDFIQSPG